MKSNDSLKNSFDVSHAGQGGWLGYVISWPMFKGFDFWVSFFILFIVAIFSFVLIT